MSEPVPSVPPNHLAGALTATIYELAEVRLLHAAERDYLAWLQHELCKARNWTILDVLAAWNAELDRRGHQREAMRSDLGRVA